MTADRPNQERLMLVSADGHAVGQPDLYRPYFPKGYEDALDELEEEHQEHLEHLAIFATYDDATLDLIDGQSAIRTGGTTGAHDVARRLREMDREGIAAELVIVGSPSGVVPFFATTNRPYPVDLQLVGARAYNRWIADFLAEADGRLIGVGYPGPCIDIDEAVTEVHWLADHGFHAVSLPGMVALDATPALRSLELEPFWRACEERQLALLVHAGHGRAQGETHDFIRRIYETSSSREEAINRLANEEDSPFALDLRPRQAMWRMMASGVFDRFPDLTLVLTEVRGDWLPPTLGLLDKMFDGADVPSSRKPSEYWQTNCFAALSFMHRAEAEMRAEIGLDRIMFGRDYPHPEGTWPNTQEWLRDALRNVPVADAKQILGENAVRCYGLDERRLRGIADRIGPTVEALVGNPEAVSPAMLDEFQRRGGYLKPAEAVDTSRLAELVLADLG